MVYKTSQVNKQDIRNKVAAKSRTVKQAPTAAKTHSGRHRLHRNLTVPRGTLLRHRLCQDVTLLRWLQQHLLDYLQRPQPLLSVTATVCPVCLPSVWPCILKGHGWNMLSSFFQSPLTLWSLLVSCFPIPSFSSALFIPSHHFKHHSTFTVVILVSPDIPVLSWSSVSLFFQRRYDFSQLKIKRSLLKKIIKHLFHLAASKMDREEHHCLRSVESHL